MGKYANVHPINVLSLFDGMSCGRIALERVGIPINKYFASEIDKHAIEVSKHNYPDIIQIGDVVGVKGSDLPKIDLLIGGSPCQGFSFAGKGLNFDDPRSKLFFEFVRIVDECNPTYFFLENVKMKKDYRDVITEYMGIEPILINSNLVSAQNRNRLYWTNIPGVSQPEDRGIFLQDVVEPDVSEDYCVDVSSIGIHASSDLKCVAFTERRTEEAKRLRREHREKHGGDFSPRRAKEMYPRSDGKMNCLTASYSLKEHTLLDEKSRYRKLTTVECERLQTIPDNYTAMASESQRYKMLGNGWTADVIAHIFRGLRPPVKRCAVIERRAVMESVNVLSLFDGISCGRVALERVRMPVNKYYASEIDEYAIRVAKKNYPKTIHIGDVEKVKGSDLPRIDLLIGGSPCQGFSFAGRQLNFDDPRSKLFFEFVRLVKECKPKYFLLENVKMKKEYEDLITRYMGVEPIEINSSLVSAQNRVRLYWTNIPGISQPRDRRITIRDILEQVDVELTDFSSYNPRRSKNYFQFDVSGKAYNSQQDRAFYIDGKFGCFPNARAVTKRKIAVTDTHYRNLTAVECERLQTVPDGYTFLEEDYSINKSLSALGNGWTVDVIAHIFKGLFLPFKEKPIRRCAVIQRYAVV